MDRKLTYEELEQRVRKLEEEVTEYKQTEQALRRERDKLQKYLHVARAITVVIDADQKVSLINRKGCEVLGYEANEIEGKNWFDNFLPERVKEDLRSGFIELMAAPKKDINEIFEDGGENPILTKGGKERIIAWRNAILKDEQCNITATMSSGEDVTEARRAEKALRESENKYRTLLENIPQKIFHKDRHSVYVSCNENYARDLMIKPEDIAGKTDHDFFPKELAEKYRKDDTRIIEAGKTEYIEEKYLQDGKEIFVQTVKTPIKDKEGHITGLLGIFWDITHQKEAAEALQKAHNELEQRVKERTSELIKTNQKLKQEIEDRKRAEEALRESENKYHDLYDNAPDMYVSVDAKTAKIIECNQTLIDRLGYTREEIIGRPVFDMYSPDSAEYSRRKMFPEFVKTGEIEVEELQLQRKDGTTVNVYLKASAVRNPEGKILYSISSWRDISEKKKLEAQLQHAQKLESIGTLTSGIAHNFRNLLTPISLYSQFLQMAYKDDPQLQEMAEKTGESVKRGAQLVDGLMQFCRKHAKEIETIDLAEVLRETYGLITKSFDKNIDIRMDIADSLLIRGDRSELSQVFMNLCTNARDAMPDGGELSIEASMEGDDALITISDTGAGMDEQTREQCFDPFFTTKEADKGTGLGLSTAYGIVKDHGGEIHVFSELNKGTTFKLYFPSIFLAK